MKGVKSPQRMILKTPKGLLEGVLKEVTEIGVGEVGLHGGL